MLCSRLRCSWAVRLALFLSMWLGVRAVAAAEPCSQELVDQALGRVPCTLCRKSALHDDSGLPITCDLTLPAGARVKHKLLYIGEEASNTRLRCEGAEEERAVLTHGITIKSAPAGDGADGFPRASRPQHVRVSGCVIEGNIRLRGSPLDGDPEAEVRSCKLAGHVERMRAWAPADISFDDVRVVVSRGIPIYVYPGVTGFTLRRSRIVGAMEGLAHAPDRIPTLVYLDSETTGALLQDNVFQVTARDPLSIRHYRELIAIDASDHNRIIGNVFYTTGNGGIFLYRNCGERGRSRWISPTHNEIINNTFIEPAAARLPSIWLGSRSNKPWPDCRADDGFPFGSGTDDRDFARDNVVAGNRRVVAKGERAVLVAGGTKAASPIDFPNFIFQNELVSEAPVRPSGCWLWRGFHTQFVADGATVLTVASGQSEERSCQRLRCVQGVLEEGGTCAAQAVEIQCRAQAGARGCSVEPRCPEGTEIIGAQVACDAREGLLTVADLAETDLGSLRMVRAAQGKKSGWCYAGSASVSNGSAAIHGPAGATSLRVGCLESDLAAGRCGVLGTLFCAAQVEETAPAATP